MKTSTNAWGGGLLIPSLYCLLASGVFIDSESRLENCDPNYKTSLTIRAMIYTMMAAPPIHIIAWTLAYKKETNLFFLLDAIPIACVFALRQGW